MTRKKVEERPDGVAGFLEDIRQDLRQGTYQPQPIRQRLIPKPGKLGKFRPLGIGERTNWRMGDKKLALFSEAKRILFPDRGMHIPNKWDAKPDERFLKGADKFWEATRTLAML